MLIFYLCFGKSAEMQVQTGGWRQNLVEGAPVDAEPKAGSAEISTPSPKARSPHWFHLTLFPTFSFSIIPSDLATGAMKQTDSGKEPGSGSFQMSRLFASGGQSIGASASVLPINDYSEFISFRTDWLVWSSRCPRDSQESSAAQFKSMNSLTLSLFYGPVLTSVHDYWKNHSFDYMDFIGKVMSLLFNTLSLS